jgi:hypothetical protein
MAWRPVGTPTTVLAKHRYVPSDKGGHVTFNFSDELEVTHECQKLVDSSHTSHTPLTHSGGSVLARVPSRFEKKFLKEKHFFVCVRVCVGSQRISLLALDTRTHTQLVEGKIARDETAGDISDQLHDAGGRGGWAAAQRRRMPRRAQRRHPLLGCPAAPLHPDSRPGAVWRPQNSHRTSTRISQRSHDPE